MCRCTVRGISHVFRGVSRTSSTRRGTPSNLGDPDFCGTRVGTGEPSVSLGSPFSGDSRYGVSLRARFVSSVRYVWEETKVGYLR